MVYVLVVLYFVVGVAVSLYMMFFSPVAKYTDRVPGSFVGGLLFGWWLWPLLLPHLVKSHKRIHANPSWYGAHVCDRCGALATHEAEDGSSFRCKAHGR